MCPIRQAFSMEPVMNSAIELASGQLSVVQAATEEAPAFFASQLGRDPRQAEFNEHPPAIT
jgi:hypothetical protein